MNSKPLEPPIQTSRPKALNNLFGEDTVQALTPKGPTLLKGQA